MSLVLSNAFKGDLLSSYVNIRYELAVKSMQDLINKRNVKLFNDNLFTYIRNETPQFRKIKDRISKKNPKEFTKFYVYINEELKQLENGEAVLICQSYRCPVHLMYNPHINLIYTDHHYFHGFLTLRVNKYHSHSRQIYKL